MDSTEGRHGVAGGGARPAVEVAIIPRVVERATVPPTVIVVGAGVSGCACAAELASAGLHVTLVNSAMDRVGLPVYGPDLIDRDRERQAGEAIRGLPSPLRSVWLHAATMPAGGEAMLNIDRRKVSIETKRALEEIPGLEFRQGFVTDLRLVGERCDATTPLSRSAAAKSDGGGRGRTREHGIQTPDQRVRVETIFGEVFEADAVVVAVGLSLGGRINAGSDAVHGGRYGEPESEGLRAALGVLGAEFRETSVKVGPRVSARSARARGWLADTSRVDDETEDHDQALGSSGASLLREEPLLAATSDPAADCWPTGYPPAPHWQADLRTDRVVMMSGSDGRVEAASFPALSPDGAATSEVYLAPESEFANEVNAGSGDAVSIDEASVDETGPIASRVSMTVTGLVVARVGDSGRMWCNGEPGPVWVVGRSAGAQDYAASLSSGVAAAREIARSLARGIAQSRVEPAAGRLAASPSATSDEGGQGSGT
jgi:hypothetical protein